MVYTHTQNQYHFKMVLILSTTGFLHSVSYALLSIRKGDVEMGGDKGMSLFQIEYLHIPIPPHITLVTLFVLYSFLTSSWASGQTLLLTIGLLDMDLEEGIFRFGRYGGFLKNQMAVSVLC